MLNFRSNFFFLQFSSLFFFIIIFGFWSIDLNSEEIYIAFGFFIMLVLSFVFFRANLLLLFMRILNSKCSAILDFLLKIRRLYKIQLIDFTSQSTKRLDFLNSHFYGSSTSKAWANKCFLFMCFSCMLWVKRSLLFIALASSNFFFVIPTFQVVSFQLKSNSIFTICLS